MNERIKELYGPAYKFAKENCVRNIDDIGNNYFKLFHEKFAELIVRECAGKVDFILREKKAGGGTMGDEIREHFGVEL